MLRANSIRDYWVKTIVWLVLIYGGYAAAGFYRLSEAWNFVFIALAIAQTVLIYRALRDGNRSPWIIAVFFIALNFGPEAELGNRTLYLSNLIYLLPVIAAGWPSKKFASKNERSTFA